MFGTRLSQAPMTQVSPNRIVANLDGRRVDISSDPETITMLMGGAARSGVPVVNCSVPSAAEKADVEAMTPPEWTFEKPTKVGAR